ncbi:RES family NAD+ phosphorylase [Yersinia enterocolitica]|nr:MULTISPECIES: RES family NAD+ phosphorylase [Enterobacterales]PVY71237.1 RES domain-containing protein [Pectobacterium versatile]CFQ11179.1 RES domain [Yersinia enterocolitica]CNC10064.1 RES domain [Yersinia enterocolitica]CNE01344.1 RES domain [Yersinia enterocolitica]CQD52368.1 RES domain [Yersinia enterocolitica]
MCRKAPHKTWICTSCIDEPFLSAHIKSAGPRKICHFCSKKRPCFNLEKISDLTETAIEQHFIRTPVDPSPMEYAMIKYGRHGWYRAGDEIECVIENLLQTRPEIASAVQQFLEDRHSDFDSASMGEETEFASESHYEERRKVDTGHLDGLWKKFITSLQTESRYINHSVRETLYGIFNGLETMQVGREQTVIVKAGPGTAISSLYRARWSNSHEMLEKILVLPDRELGPPPHRSSGSNRMSARGISVFYGASSVETAISEIRPPVGCDVVSAGFRLIRPLRLLNLPALESVWESGSMFDPDYINKRAQVAFLRTLSRLMTDPVLPGEEEFRYIPTQVIAEYLADAPRLALDGILYPSVQQPALPSSENYNVVLFHKASRVQYQALPAQDACQINFGHHCDEDEWEVDICVTQTAESAEFVPGTTWIDTASHVLDTREPAMEIDLVTVSVHHIGAVHFDYSSDTVRRSKHIVEVPLDNHVVPESTILTSDSWQDDIPF